MTNQTILDRLRTGECVLHYSKKDGSVKETTGTLNQEMIDEAVETAPLNPQSMHHADTHVTYFDTESEGFRTFLFENVLLCQVT